MVRASAARRNTADNVRKGIKMFMLTATRTPERGGGRYYTEGFTTRQEAEAVKAVFESKNKGSIYEVRDLGAEAKLQEQLAFILA